METPNGNQGADEVRGVKGVRGVREFREFREIPRGGNRRRLGYFCAKRGNESGA